MKYLWYRTPKWPQLPPRNAPCPCGRRKKFKNCCLKAWNDRLDAQRKETPDARKECYQAQAPIAPLV
jgi:hypothetical protein